MSQCHKVINFTAGCVGRHFATWQKLTSDKDFLSSSSGSLAENCNEDFLAIETKFETNFSAKKETFSSREIENLLKKNFIMQNILVSKPPGSYRLILDLKKKIPILEYHQSV